MRTVLFIDNSFCSSFEQLKSILEEGISSYSPLYDELITLQRDGILSSWLSEGQTREEKLLADMLSRLPHDLSNSELMKQLVKLFSNKDYCIIYAPSIKTFVDIESLELHVVNDSNSLLITNFNEEIIIEKGQLLSSFFNLWVKPTKIDNEVFKLFFLDSEKNVGNDVELIIEKLTIGEKTSIKIPFPIIDLGVHCLKLCSGAECLFSMKVNVVNSIQNILNLDDFRAFKIGEITLGVSKSTDFGCKNNDEIKYKGATITFTKGKCSCIRVNSDEEVFSIFLSSIINGYTDKFSFNDIENKLGEKGFKCSNTNIEIDYAEVLKQNPQYVTFLKNKYSSAFELSMDCFFSRMLQGGMMMNDMSRLLYPGAIKMNLFVYEEELRKANKYFTCILKFSSKCSKYGTKDLSVMRSVPGTLEEIVVKMKNK